MEEVRGAQVVTLSSLMACSGRLLVDKGLLGERRSTSLVNITGGQVVEHEAEKYLT